MKYFDRQAFVYIHILHIMIGIFVKLKSTLSVNKLRLDESSTIYVYAF